MPKEIFKKKGVINSLLIILVFIILTTTVIYSNKKLEQQNYLLKQNINNLNDMVTTYETELTLQNSQPEQEEVIFNEDKNNCEHLPYNKYDLAVQNLIEENKIYLEPACKIFIENQIKSVNHLGLNGKSFIKSDNELYKEYDEYYYVYKNDDELNEKIKNITSNNKYNFVNGCLYKDGISIFNYSMQNYFMVGFFNNNSDIIIESIDEWFRFENNNKLYIFLLLSNTRGPASGGYYLEIDLLSDQIKAKKEKIPYNIIRHENNKKAIEIDDGSDSIKLYLFDLIEVKRKELIYEIPKNKTLLITGDGLSIPIEDAIKWINQDTISIQLYETGNPYEGLVSEIEVEENGKTVIQFVKSGEPLIFNISEY